MQHADFVPLHVHTEYSLLDGAIKIDELVQQAVQYKLPAVAITDHGGLFGAVEFYKKATKAGVKPIIGCEVYIAPGSRLDRQKANIDGLSDEAAFHLILLARNRDGYRNLCRLVTKAYLEGFYYKPRIDKDLLEQFSGGLIGLSACLKGEVPFYLAHDRWELARERALWYKRVLGPDNFYLEIQSNGLAEQIDVNWKLIQLSQELHIPLVATNDCHYLRQEDTRAHDILLCIGTGKTVNDEKRMSFGTDQCYFKSPQEMKAAFADMPEAIQNTVKIAERCNFDFELGKPLLPKYEVPEGYTPGTYLEELALKGVLKKLRTELPKNYQDRLDFELKVIRKMGFASYFLIVWDFIKHAKTNGIPVGPGRGSAAGSLVAYGLGITEIDPIRYHLLFERFLNPDRVSMPDIDVDFCKDRRQEVITYVQDKYGKESVAQIITFGTLASKAAVRDVGRVLHIPYADVDRIAKLIPTGPDVKSLDHALKLEPQLKELYDNDPQVREMIDIAKRLEGLSRHASTHAAGVVIAPEPLTNYTALYKQPSEDVVTTQFDMGSVEAVGLLKFDFLGLKTLTIIDKTLQFLKQQGRELDISEIPLDDDKTYALLSSGESTGIFQLESAGMRDILVKMHPNVIEDLIALVALYRPGPIGSGMIDEFIKRKKGEVPIEYDLPQLSEVLAETYGIILYQEQVMMIANKIAGFSMAQADVLRKIMGKKKPDEMAKQKEGFVIGAVAKGIPEQKAGALFELIAKFAEYGFNKSHSAAYGYVAYQTAYLKAHYPVEFMTANLSADMGDTDRIVILIEECRKAGIEVMPPDMNESDREFKIVGSSIRFGLEAVKGVGSAAIEIMISERSKAPFATFEDFMSRVDGKKVNKKVIESLIKSGAFDSLYAARGMNRFIARATATATVLNPARSQNGGMSLFGEPELSAASQQIWDETMLLGYEKDALGFFVSGHPLTKYRKTLSIMNVSRISDLLKRIEQAGKGEDEEIIETSIAGVITDMKTKAREKGVTGFVTIEDETGRIEALVFGKTYQEKAELLKKNMLVVLRGNVMPAEKGARIMARDVRNLAEVEVREKFEVTIDCADEEAAKTKIAQVKKLLTEDAVPGCGNGGSVTIRCLLSDCCVIIATQMYPCQNFAAEAERTAACTVRCR
ncbi:MAG TPA: DNA polymerase III subunit alpha [Dissulfurispiraceae bacterium]|nr:DNA polymerase III subunit alpha [Dissulfurispiraceae bacterium]